MNVWHRIQRRPPAEPEPPEPLTTDHIEAAYRLFWTKLALDWDDARRATIAQQVSVVIGGADFENNALERRFRVEALDDQAHSGASLLALLEVLDALDAFDAGAGTA